MGKAPVGIATEAKRHGAAVIALCGCVGDGAEDCNGAGIDAFFPIIRAPMTATEAMQHDTAEKNLFETARQALLLMQAAASERR